MVPDGTLYWSGYILYFSSYGQSLIEEDTALQWWFSGTNSRIQTEKNNSNNGITCYKCLRRHLM